MARRSARARPDQERMLCPARRVCPACSNPMRVRYENRRTLVTLSGAVRLRLKIRRCEQVGCARHHGPYRPEEESAIALPQHEFGLDVVALVGALRYRDHRSVPARRPGPQAQGAAGQGRQQPGPGGAKGGCSSPQLTKLRQLIGRGLEHTAPLWPDVERAYAWVQAAARVLNNHQDESAAVVRRRFDGLVGAMVRHRGKAGALADAIGRFRKVARSYRPGLFHCYGMPDLPRTNNDLEQWFGA